MREELVRGFRYGHGALFVGAGLSIGGGLKGWADLIAPLRAELEAERKQDLSDRTLLQVAELYERGYGRQALVEALRAGLPRFAGSWTAVHKAMLGLPVTEIFTTNYDQFIESAAQDMRRDFMPASTALAAFDWLPAAQPGELPPFKLVKLHGDYDLKDEIVVTDGDYARATRKKRALFELLRRAFQQKVVLILGYSFNDPDMKEVLDCVRKEQGRYRRNVYIAHFADPSWSGVRRAAERRHWEKLGLTPVTIPLANGQTPNEALERWLVAFAAEVRPAAKPVAAPAQPQHNLPVRQGWLGRESEIRQLMDAFHRNPVVSFRGPPGAGKTSVALEVAHRCFESGGFNYVVWIDGRELGPDGISLWAVMNAVQRTAGFDLGPASSSRDPTEHQHMVKLEEERRNKFVHLLAFQRLLIVLDNFEAPGGLAQRPHNDPRLLDLLTTLQPGRSNILVTTSNVPLPVEVAAPGLSLEDALAYLDVLLRAAAWVHPFAYSPRRDLERFTHRFHGNPMLMKLAFRLIGDDLVRSGDLLKEAMGKDVEEISTILHERIWAALGDDAHKLLQTLVLFAGGSIRRHAVRTLSRLTPARFERAVVSCGRFGLIESEGEGDSGRLLVHATTLKYIRSRAPVAEEVGPAQFADYYLDVVHGAVARRRPRTSYWNALVGDRMRLLDGEWPNIIAAVQWAAHHRHDQFVQFVLLLVHYMDSRTLNAERIVTVRAAAAMLEEREEIAKAAVLRLDALGWTLLEEGQFDAAVAEIRAGIKLAKRLQGRAREDLLTLGKAWTASYLLSQGDAVGAEIQAKEALLARSRPWIRARARMAAGDVALALGRPAEALQHYLRSGAIPVNAYSGEGDGYQSLPRIGLAELHLGRAGPARATFAELAEAGSDISLAGLYAAYGAALADCLERPESACLARVRETEAALKERAPPSPLRCAFVRFANSLGQPTSPPRRPAPRKPRGFAAAGGSPSGVSSSPAPPP